jgi:hypothetical protein
MNRIVGILCCTFFTSGIFAGEDNIISLHGTWYFQTDPDDIGINEEWYLKQLEETIILPGSMAENGKGDIPTLETKWTGSIFDSSWFFNPAMEKYRQPGNIKFPFWLTPEKYYTGAAWYQKKVTIPDNWKDKHITLFLERPHWQTSIWINGNPGGSDNSLSAPHQFDISHLLHPGNNIITILVDNRCKDVDPGINSHSITDHTQGNWNGIAGRIELISGSKVHISDMKIYPDLKTKSVETDIVIKGKDIIAGGSIRLSVVNPNHPAELIRPVSTNIDKYSDTIIIIYPMGENIRLWDEFSPELYIMKATLSDENGILDVKNETFGMREFKIEGTRFEINRRPVFLRGTVECCVFPLTGYPPTDELSWARIFEICKSYGLNHMRFHSYCPPEAAFISADKAGIYLQVEGPSWAKYSTTLGEGKPIDKYIYKETESILREYGNHPSFCMMAYGNEPSGNYVTFLDDWLEYFKRKDSRRVYTGASIGGSWTIIPKSEFIVRSKPRGLKWKDNSPESIFDYRDRLENQERPYVTHEMGQWCVFPNFKETEKYTGPLKARNFELFEEDLNDKHMGDQASDFLIASGKLQASCYKQEIEASFRTPGLAGFQLLSLNDFSGQGTALVGVLDAFWDEKGYITSGEFNKFCNSTIALARIPRFVFTNAENFTAGLEISHFGSEPLENAAITWEISNETGEIIGRDSLPAQTIPIGNCNRTAKIKFPLNNIEVPARLTLEVSVNDHTNSWNFWVYPEKLPLNDTTGIYFCNELDNKATAILNKGGKVFLMAAGRIENGKDVIQYLTPVFWNTSWFRMRPPHTTGILIKNRHPAFSDFPTDFYSDLQWWDISNNQQCMNLEKFPVNFRPLIQPIDTWFLNRRLAMLFEANVSSGKLIVCSIDLQNDLNNRPVARQLLHSLISYMNSDLFEPQDVVSPDVVKELFEKKQRKGWNSFVKDNP